MKKFIYIILSTVILFLIGQSIYKQINKTGAKSARLECHKSSTVFERVLKKELLEQLQNDIRNGKLQVEVETEKAKYMESKLFQYINAQDVKNEFEKLIKQTKNISNIKNKVNILIYENDKNDPGKKTEKSKLYAGYLVFSFKVEGSLVYKLQIDFLDHQGKDISRVLECALESILTIKGKE